MKVSSGEVSVQATDQKIYSIINNFSNFESVLPEQVKDWEKGDDYCKFSVDGMITLTLRVLEKREFSKIVFKADNDHNIPILFSFLINAQGDRATLELETELEVPMLLSGMVKKPLQTFVDKTAEKIKTAAEK